MMERSKFAGFPAQFKGTALPNLYLSAVLPEVTDPAELVATLFVLRDAQAKRTFPRYARRSELLNDLDLRRALINIAVRGDTAETESAAGGDGLLAAAEEALRRGLDAAVRRGSLASLPLASGDEIYCLNSPSERKALERIRDGTLLAESPAERQEEVPERENVFRLYEDNIGPLTPIMADRLLEAEQEYPQHWIGEAIEEAVANNARSWNYIEAILRRWQAEGRAEIERKRPGTLKESWERYLGRSLTPRR